MANEIMKEIKTRIALKYNTYEYWTTGEGKDYAPLKGEVCFCAIESKDQGAQTAPTVLFKVGVDGQTKFSALKWASALAADVYDWAKTAGANVFTKDGVGNVVSGIEYDATLNGGKGGFKFTTASVATAEGLEDLQETVAAIEKDVTDNRDAWAKNDNTTYQFSIPTTGNDKGKLLVEKKEIGETTWTRVNAYDFVTPDELTETLKDYYTKGEVADIFATKVDIKTSVFEYGIDPIAFGGWIKDEHETKGLLAVEKKVDDIDSTIATIGRFRNPDFWVDANDLSVIENPVYGDIVMADNYGSAELYMYVEFWGEGHSSGWAKVINADDNEYKNLVYRNGVIYNDYLKSSDKTELSNAIALKADKSVVDAMYTNAKIDELVQGAKDYADAKPHENTAHTHVSGSGIKVDNAGGISGEVKADLNVAFELVDKTIKLYDKDDATKAAIATLDATEFIADGMLSSVTADQTNNKLIFEWNTDAGVTKTEIPLSSIADIYTGSNGTEVNVAVSNQNVISASLNSEVATKITHGETAYNWGNHANAGYAANADLIKVINGTTPVAKATSADNADKLDNHDSTYFATKESVDAIPGIIDDKIREYDVGRDFGDIVTHNAAEFATSAQGAAADTALQSVKVLGQTLTYSANEITVAQAKTALGLGTMAGQSKDSYQLKSNVLTNFAKYWQVNDSGVINSPWTEGDDNISNAPYSIGIDHSKLVIYDPSDSYQVTLTKNGLSVLDGANGGSASYTGTGISNNENFISFPDHAGLMAVIDTDGNLGGVYDHELKHLMFGYDNYWAEISKHPTFGGMLTLSNATDSEAATIEARYLARGMHITNASNSYSLSFPDSGGEFVVAGSTEIVYVLDCN